MQPKVAVNLGLWAVLAALTAASLTGGCSSTSVRESVDSVTLRGRKTLFLEPTHIPPIERELQDQIVGKLEASLGRSPNLGELVTREAFRRQTETNKRLRQTHDIYANTLAVAGFSERQTSMELRKVVGTELLLMTQLIYMPCPHCDEFNRIALIGNLVNAESGAVVWRAHLIKNFLKDSLANRTALAETLVTEFLEVFEESIRPKWHRERFYHLAEKGRAAP